MARPEEFPALVSKWRVLAQSLERQLPGVIDRFEAGVVAGRILELKKCADGLEKSWRRRQARQARQKRQEGF